MADPRHHPRPGGELGAREVIGNLLAWPAPSSDRRFVWAWPVGLVGNVLLFTGSATGGSPAPWPSRSGAGRAPGLLRRRVALRLVALDAAPATPAAPPTAVPRAPLGHVARACPTAGPRVVGYGVAYALLLQIGSWGPTTEAWILAGSMLATYGMARGWVEFWLVWLLVDIVGVRSLITAGYYPTAGMYVVYAAFVVLGSSCGCVQAALSTRSPRPPTSLKWRCPHECASGFG